MDDRPPPCAVLTLTLNPALDVSTAVARVTPGPKLRCGPAKIDPGGGGLNVSRALRFLGAESLALVALGGVTGKQLAALLRAEAITFQALESPGDTRQSLTVTETDSGQQYRFLLPGPVWQTDDQARALAQLTAARQPGGIAVLSGSQPPGIPVGFAGELAGALAGMQVILDTSGDTLAEVVARPIPGLAVLRMDRDEAETLADRPLPLARDTADFASDLVAQGVARTVIIARGAMGNVLAQPKGRLLGKPPEVPLVSAVGAGDSFVAGLVLALSRGQGWDDALAMGTAAAAAAVMTPATDLCRAEDVARVLPQVQITAL